MKKTIFAVLLVCMIPFSSALADHDIGCGLGTNMLEGNSGLVMKLLGTCLNGLSGNQTFGITSGTLGCKSDGTISTAERVSLFAGANIDKLAADMAVGQGETLNALADLYGMTPEHRATFYGMVKDNFATIFASQNLTAGDMMNAMHQLMSTDQQLVGYVG